MDVIITAGGIPQPGEPLYEYTKGRAKALLPIAGKPMAQWVLDAVGGSAHVERLVIVGLDAESGVTCSRPMAFIPNQGGMVDNIRAAIAKIVELNPEAGLILIVSSDIPAVTTEMVDWSIQTALETEDDIYYNIITSDVMERRYPGSRRSYIKFKDVAVCGGDMNIVRASAAYGNDELWEGLVAARKNALKQAALLGYGTLFLMLTRQLALKDAAPRVSKKLGLRGRVILSPYAEIGMDVDKPYQFELLRADLEKKVSAA